MLVDASADGYLKLIPKLGPETNVTKELSGT
jgi:hypothetical protein